MDSSTFQLFSLQFALVLLLCFLLFSIFVLLFFRYFVFCEKMPVFSQITTITVVPKIPFCYLGMGWNGIKLKFSHSVMPAETGTIGFCNNTLWKIFLDTLVIHWWDNFCQKGFFSLTVWVLDVPFSYFSCCNNLFTFSNICFDTVCWLPFLSSLMLISLFQVPNFSGFTRLWLHPFSFSCILFLTICCSLLSFVTTSFSLCVERSPSTALSPSPL